MLKFATFFRDDSAGPKGSVGGVFFLGGKGGPGVKKVGQKSSWIFFVRNIYDIIYIYIICQYIYSYMI